MQKTSLVMDGNYITIVDYFEYLGSYIALTQKYVENQICQTKNDTEITQSRK